MKRRRPDAVLSADWENLRLACEAAKVPLRDLDGLDLLDEHVATAVETAREGATLAAGAQRLYEAVALGKLPLGGRTGIGRPTASELLALASVLRSPVANKAAAT